MRRKKFISLAGLAILALCQPIGLFAQHKGEKSVGLRGGFTTRNTTATAGLYFSYRFSEHFRVAPKLDYAFPHHDTDAFTLDLDFESPFALSKSERVSFYPIAGLNYSTFSKHEQNISDSSDDTSQRSNEFGITLGAGLEYLPTATLRLAVEAKGTVIRKYSGGWFNLSIGYIF